MGVSEGDAVGGCAGLLTVSGEDRVHKAPRQLRRVEGGVLGGTGRGRAGRRGRGTAARGRGAMAMRWQAQRRRRRWRTPPPAFRTLSPFRSA